MAGFEIVVRPVVFPDIRPRPTQSLPPAADPTQGFALIHGNGGKEISLSNSNNSSTSTSTQRETQRRVDTARVYQMDDDGTVNPDNFIDIEVANKIWMKGPSKSTPGFNGDDLVSTTPGRGFTGDDIVPKSKGGKADEVTTQYYDRMRTKPNIEIIDTDKLIKAGDN